MSADYARSYYEGLAAQAAARSTSALIETRASCDSDLRELEYVERQERLMDSNRMVELIEAELAEVDAAEIRERYYQLVATLCRAEWSLNAIAAGSDPRALLPRSRDAFRNLLRQAREAGQLMERAVEEELRS